MENNLNLTPEILEKAKSAPSAAELLTLAQENGITLTAEQAATYYTELHPETGELSDEELDNVSGGGLCHPEKCKFCGHTEFDWLVGAVPPFFRWFCKNCHRGD